MFCVKHPTNPQKDRDWAENKADISLRMALKNLANVMVSGVATAQELTELKVVSQKQTVVTDHHVYEILTKTRLPALCRLSRNGTILKRKMAPKMSESNFMQDGAPAQASKKSQEWCRDILPALWEKQV